MGAGTPQLPEPMPPGLSLTCAKAFHLLPSLAKASLTHIQRQLNQRAYLSSTTSTPICGGSASRNATAKSLLASSASSPARSYSQGSAISRLAKSALSPGASAETYIAYGMTQKLFQACSSQADYQVPQASQKGVAVPTTESGEHLGTSESWWYKGKLALHYNELGTIPSNQLTNNPSSNVHQNSASSPHSQPGPKSPSSTCTS